MNVKSTEAELSWPKMNKDSSVVKGFFRGYRVNDFIKIIIFETKKRFSEKPIVAFTNSTVFILGFYIL